MAQESNTKLYKCKRWFFRVLCILALIIQSALMDVYLIKYKGNNWYGIIAGDVIVVIIFILAIGYSAFFFEKPGRVRKLSKKVSESVGELPLGWLSWLFYAALLCFKVVIIFKDVAGYLVNTELFGPNALKLIMASSSFVFLFLLQTHTDAKPKSPEAAFLSLLGGSVTFGILDSVAFLEVLFTSQSKILLPFRVTYALIAFACFNLILPTLSLLGVSHTRFSRSKEIIHVTHVIAYLILVNLPFAAFRIFLWSHHLADISVFLIKNVVAIGRAVTEMIEYFSDKSKVKAVATAEEAIPDNESGGASTKELDKIDEAKSDELDGNNDALELKPFGSGK